MSCLPAIFVLCDASCMAPRASCTMGCLCRRQPYSCIVLKTYSDKASLPESTLDLLSTEGSWWFREQLSECQGPSSSLQLAMLSTARIRSRSARSVPLSHMSSFARCCLFLIALFGCLCRLSTHQQSREDINRHMKEIIRRRMSMEFTSTPGPSMEDVGHAAARVSCVATCWSCYELLRLPDRSQAQRCGHGARAIHGAHAIFDVRPICTHRCETPDKVACCQELFLRRWVKKTRAARASRRFRLSHPPGRPEHHRSYFPCANFRSDLFWSSWFPQSKVILPESSLFF